MSPHIRRRTDFRKGKMFLYEGFPEKLPVGRIEPDPTEMAHLMMQYGLGHVGQTTDLHMKWQIIISSDSPAENHSSF